MYENFKIKKGPMKCFGCRKLTPQQGGSWCAWKSQKAWLCSSCERATKSRTERQR